MGYVDRSRWLTIAGAALLGVGVGANLEKITHPSPKKEADSAPAARVDTATRKIHDAAEEFLRPPKQGAFEQRLEGDLSLEQKTTKSPTDTPSLEVMERELEIGSVLIREARIYHKAAAAGTIAARQLSKEERIRLLMRALPRYNEFVDVHFYQDDISPVPNVIPERVPKDLLEPDQQKKAAIEGWILEAQALKKTLEQDDRPVKGLRLKIEQIEIRNTVIGDPTVDRES